VSVVDWPSMRTGPTDEVTVTVTTLAVLLLPQPLIDNKQSTASHGPKRLDNLPTFVPTISPTRSRRGSPADAGVAILYKKLVPNFDHRSAIRSPQNVRLTVKRKVVFGSK